MTAYTSLTEKLFNTPTKLAQRIQRRGLGDALGWCWYQFQWRWREWRLGARTHEYAHNVIVKDDGNHHGYEPIDYLCFDKVLEYLQPISTSDGFLDYGCGMGRAVILAATCPYGHVLGVELDSKLANVARQQIELVRKRGCLQAEATEILEQDATRFAIPHYVNHIFLFNSFTGDVLLETLEQIRCSLERNPRHLKLIYIQPLSDDDPLANIPWLRLDQELSTGYWMHVRSRAYTNVKELESTRIDSQSIDD